MGEILLKVVAKDVEHSTIQTIMRYSQLVSKLKCAAVDAMGGFYGSGLYSESKLTSQPTPALWRISSILLSR